MRDPGRARTLPTGPTRAPQPEPAVGPTLGALMAKRPTEEPEPGFQATWGGEVVRVTAVLELTAIVEDGDAARHVARLRTVVPRGRMVWRLRSSMDHFGRT